MDTNKSSVRKRVIIFVLIAFIIAWALFLSIPLSGISYGSGISAVLLAAAMFAPSAANVLTRLITREGFGEMYLRPNFKGHIKAYLLVFFAPTLLILFSGVVYFLIFPSQFDYNLTTLNSIAAMGSGKGLTASNILLLSVLQVLIIGPVINIIPTLGEELGWRGYLLPRLRLLFSDRAAFIISGVIWGLWHAPAIALGHNYGTFYPGFPYLGILAMIVFCFALGTIEGYVSIKLKSAIPAAMIHSAINAGAGLPMYLVKGSYNTLLGPTIAGLIGGLPFIVIAVFLLILSGGSFNSGEPPLQSEDHNKQQ